MPSSQPAQCMQQAWTVVYMFSLKMTGTCVCPGNALEIDPANPSVPHHDSAPLASSQRPRRQLDHHDKACCPGSAKDGSSPANDVCLHLAMVGAGGGNDTPWCAGDSSRQCCITLSSCENGDSLVGIKTR